MGFREQLNEGSRDSYVLTQKMLDMAATLERYYDDVDTAIAMMDEGTEGWRYARDDGNEAIGLIRESFHKFRNVLVDGTDIIDVLIQTQKDREEGL